MNTRCHADWFNVAGCPSLLPEMTGASDVQYLTSQHTAFCYMFQQLEKCIVCHAAVYDCRCGFSSGTAVGFQRHIARYKGSDKSKACTVQFALAVTKIPDRALAGETGKHRMVKRALATTTSSVETADTLAAEPSRPSERSWLSGLWASGLQKSASGVLRVPQ